MNKWPTRGERVDFFVNADRRQNVKRFQNVEKFFAESVKDLKDFKNRKSKVALVEVRWGGLVFTEGSWGI